MGILAKGLAGSGYLVLNVIRAMNITALLAVIAASVVMLVKTFNNNTFFFFDACEHVIRATICGFLTLTEIPLFPFKQYLIETWPLFSPKSGFVMLGSSMLLIGNSVLANLNKENASVDNLGLPFWRLVISSGIVVIVMGAVNIAASYIFRNKLANVTARQVRSAGAEAPNKAALEKKIAESSPKSKRYSIARPFLLKTNKKDDSIRNSILPRNSPPSYTHDLARSNTSTTASQKQQREFQHRRDSRSGGYGDLGNPYNESSGGGGVDHYHSHTHNINNDGRSPYSAPPSSKIAPFSPSSSKYSYEESPRRPDIARHPAMQNGGLI